MVGKHNLWVFWIFALGLGGSALGQTVAVNVGNGITVNLEPSRRLSIAYFMPATSNGYLQATIRAARETAARVGAGLQVFDANQNPRTQLAQVQSALESRRFNAFVVFPSDELSPADGSGPLCRLLTEDAPKADILVSVVNGRVCGRENASGAEQYAPGTYNYIGGMFGYDSFLRWVTEVARRNPGPQRVGLITASADDANSRHLDRALRAIRPQFPQFSVVSVQRAFYSDFGAARGAAAILEAHPNLDILLVIYSNQTRGAVAGLQQLGRLRGVRVYDAGGTAWVKEAIGRGWVQLSLPQYPQTMLRTAVESLAAAYQGRPRVGYIPNDGAASGELIDRNNLEGFTPEMEY